MAVTDMIIRYLENLKVIYEKCVVRRLAYKY